MSNADFVERVAMALRFDGSDATEAEREEIWAKLKIGTKQYWRDFVCLVLREIDAASGIETEGHDRATGHGAKHESPTEGDAQ